VTRGKPDPAPYLLAAKRLGVQPARCVVLEDSPTGVAAGVASGALVVAVPHLVAIEAGPRVVVVDSLAEVTLADLRSWADRHRS
jgi:beta-phosphoglucomutase-like phosphatase (HAD superfamily)